MDGIGRQNSLQHVARNGRMSCGARKGRDLNPVDPQQRTAVCQRSSLVIDGGNLARPARPRPIDPAQSVAVLLTPAQRRALGAVHLDHYIVHDQRRAGQAWNQGRCA